MTKSTKNVQNLHRKMVRSPELTKSMVLDQKPIGSQKNILVAKQTNFLKKLPKKNCRGHVLISKYKL